MREIKFRAWNKAYKRWSDHCEHGELELLDDGDGIIVDCLEEEIDVMQFTGLKDKYGKEIWEGDIIEYIPKYGDKTPRIVEIFFNDFRANFSYKGSEFANNDLFNLIQNGNVATVIGNKWENPELLTIK